MRNTGVVEKHIDSVGWQDYRASDLGMIVYYDTDPVSELAIREVPEEYPSPILPEPHYETGSYGLYGCARASVRATFVKTKNRYMFFMCKYQGANNEYADRLLITGFYRVNRTADVQKIHIRYLEEYSCIGSGTCVALRADEVHFVNLEDAVEITPELMKKWDVKGRVTRQTRIILDKEQTIELVELLRSKPNAIEDYIEETRRLQPEAEDDDEDGEDIQG